ncbi:MAG: hypothetical protein GQ564_20670 [Bacteroidales bacterium]|nr:hypothetical protein [Bacteroidales bacterium]
MSKDTILISIGALFILIGIAGSIRYKDGQVFINSIWARVLVFIIGLSLLTIGIIQPSLNLVTDANKIHKCDNCITIPQDNGVVESIIVVKGNYKKIDEDLWLIIWPEKGGNKGWPQSDDALNGRPVNKSNGRWSVSCCLGGPPQSYDIALYSASKKASEVLGTTMKDWVKSNDYPGLYINNLPKGLKELDRITVRKIKY